MPPSGDASAATAHESEGASDGTVPDTADFDLPHLRDSGRLDGLAISRNEALLESETERVDPRVDGWASEAFHEHALAQLKRLGEWLGENEPQLPSHLFASGFVASDLKPSELEQVLNGPRFIVNRWRPVDRPAAETTIEQIADAFRDLLPAGEGNAVEFKIIGVDMTTDFAATAVRCHLASEGATSTVQRNAMWKCRWTDIETDRPKMISIELEQFEEISCHARELYSDRTHALFQEEPCFLKHLALPLDHWRDRLDWRFGWQVVGAHGLSIGDVNGDGLDDVYVSETGGLPNRLLLQQPDGTVRDIARAAGVDVIEPTRSALIVDLDNDGDQDLVAAVARFVLVFENDGSAKFKRHPVLQGASMIRSLASADFNNDGLLDVYACGYNLRSGDAIGLGRPLPYHDANNGAPSYLMQNLGGFRFKDVTNEVGFGANNTRFSYAAAWEDFDNDGDLDLYVANDFGRNNLYRNDNGHFRDVAAEAGVEDVAAGMSVSWGDYNRDGLPDIYVGNMFSSAGNRIAYQRRFKSDVDDATKSMYQRHARGNSLFENVGDGTFRDVSQTAGVTEGRWAWGSNFVDINNDGWRDLVVANGMVTGTQDSGDL